MSFVIFYHNVHGFSFIAKLDLSVASSILTVKCPCHFLLGLDHQSSRFEAVHIVGVNILDCQRSQYGIQLDGISRNLDECHLKKPIIQRNISLKNIAGNTFEAAD